jgi:hypothetical protein
MFMFNGIFSKASAIFSSTPFSAAFTNTDGTNEMAVNADACLKNERRELLFLSSAEQCSLVFFIRVFGVVFKTIKVAISLKGCWGDDPVNRFSHSMAAYAKVLMFRNTVTLLSVLQ